MSPVRVRRRRRRLAKGFRSPSLIIARLSGKELKMIRKVLCIIAVALAIYFIPSAKADTDVTLNLTEQNGSPASGTLTLVETSPTSVQFDGYTLPLGFGIAANAATLLSGCSTCKWLFENFPPTRTEILYLYTSLSFEVQFECFDCSTDSPFSPLTSIGGTIPVQSRSTSVPEGSSLAMMGMTGIGLLGALKKKFLTKRV
jgi:hypothetical protein